MILVGPPIPDRSIGDDTDKKGHPDPPVWRLGVRLTTPPRKKNLLRNLKEIRLDGYLGEKMKQYTKVCG